MSWDEDNHGYVIGPGTILPAGPMARDVRLWAKANNVECPDRGKIPADVIEKYIRAHS
jgi:hypothetical protein